MCAPGRFLGFRFTWTESSVCDPNQVEVWQMQISRGYNQKSTCVVWTDEKGMHVLTDSCYKENLGFPLSRLGHRYQVFDAIWIQSTKMKEQAVLMFGCHFISDRHSETWSLHAKMLSPLLNYYDYNCQTNYSSFHQLRNCHSPFPLCKSRTPKSRWNSKAFVGINYLEMIQHEVLIFFFINLLDACACGRLQDSDNLISETRKKSDERFPWQVFLAIHETHHLPSHG